MLSAYYISYRSHNRFYLHTPGEEIWLMLDVAPLPLKSHILEVEIDNIANDLRITKTEEITHESKDY